MSAAALPECSGGNGVLAFIGCYVTHDDVTGFLVMPIYLEISTYLRNAVVLDRIIVLNKLSEQHYNHRINVLNEYAIVKQY